MEHHPSRRLCRLTWHQGDLAGYKGWCAAGSIANTGLPIRSSIPTPHQILGLQKISRGSEEVGTALEAAESACFRSSALGVGEGMLAPRSFCSELPSGMVLTPSIPRPRKGCVISADCRKTVTKG